MVDDFGGELREFRDEDRGEPRAVGAFVAREAAGRRDRGEVRRRAVAASDRKYKSRHDEERNNRPGHWSPGLGN